MKVCFLLAIVITFFFPTSSQAATWTNGLQVVNNIVWTPTHQGFYVEASAYHNPQNCSGSGEANLYNISPSLDAESKKMILSMLMTAMMNGKGIHVHLDGCHSTRTREPIFTGIQLNRN